jgi:putative adhesin
LRQVLFASLGASLGLALAAAAAHAAPKVWDQTWDVTTQADVHVVADDAHIRVHAGPARQVKVHVEYELKHWGVVMGGGEPNVVFERKSDQIWITLHDPRSIGVIGGVDERFVADVTVPTTVQLAVRTGDGAIDCEPLIGRLQLETGDGAIRARGLRGEIEVRSGDGRVTLDDLEGQLRARTRDGHLSASGRFDGLDLGAGDGRVDAFVQPGSQPASSWSVETGDGAVSIRIPHDINTLLDARTRDGHINVQLPIPLQGRLNRRELIGELNNGGPSLRIRTGDGSITLALSD